jgi:FAD:protein FMN transferase
MPCLPIADDWVARAGVALGTLIEVRLRSSQATEARFAAAFTAIGHVHRRMSAHDRNSDLARISRLAHHRAVAIDPQTFAVLSLARRLHDATDGRFDVTRGPRRMRGATFDVVTLIAPRHVAARRPITLDLGGIAKGYAVDRAVDALQAAGATQGVVNAGGDLRVFGGAWLPLHLRDPRRATRHLAAGHLRNAAAATSADYFRAGAPALFDRGLRRPLTHSSSVTVIAPSCALADALTKVVALDWLRAPPLLARFDARAIRLVIDQGMLYPYATPAAGIDCLRLTAAA